MYKDITHVHSYCLFDGVPVAVVVVVWLSCLRLVTFGKKGLQAYTYRVR